MRSPDGTAIATFRWGRGAGPPLLLVHGTTADHTAFRAVAPALAAQFDVWAIDRRGRGASGDGAAYAIEREFEDVAAVAEALRGGSGRTVDVVGHSFGGRCGLGAALRTDAIRRLVVYEGAPAPPGRSYRPPGLDGRVRARLAAGDPNGALETFLREVVGMGDAEIAAYRANPVWPLRAAAADTLVRELHAEGSPAADLDALGAVVVPVLQVLGGDSRDVFRRATEALDGRLADGRIALIDGARHAAHHTHVEAFVDVVAAFLLGDA